MTEDPVLSARISTFINTSLDNAIDNITNEVIDPITYEKMENAFELEIDFPVIKKNLGTIIAKCINTHGL